MIDLYKYSKKNKLFKYIILRILKIDIDLLTKPLFYKFSLKIDFDRNFFYDYKKKIPETKWMKMKNAYRFYQSNHDLEKYDWQKPHQPNPTGTEEAYYPNKDKDNVIDKKYKSWKSE